MIYFKFLTRMGKILRHFSEMLIGEILSCNYPLRICHKKLKGNKGRIDHFAGGYTDKCQVPSHQLLIQIPHLSF